MIIWIDTQNSIKFNNFLNQNKRIYNRPIVNIICSGTMLKAIPHLQIRSISRYKINKKAKGISSTKEKEYNNKNTTHILPKLKY